MKDVFNPLTSLLLAWNSCIICIISSFKTAQLSLKKPREYPSGPGLLFDSEDLIASKISSSVNLAFKKLFYAAFTFFFFFFKSAGMSIEFSAFKLKCSLKCLNTSNLTPSTESTHRFCTYNPSISFSFCLRFIHL